MHTTPLTASHRIRRALAVGAITLVTAGSLGACGASTPAAKTTRTTTTVASKTAPSTSSRTDTTPPQTVAAQPSGGNATGGASGGTAPNQGQPSGGNTGGGTSTPSGPTIASFTTPENIDCHNGNLQTFSVSWTTQNATKVTISIDGPGIYDTYGPNSDTSLPFNCSSSHTFLLTAYDAQGHTATKQITLQPRNVQVPDSGDDMNS